MKTWVLWILTLNAQTGDLIDSQPEPGYKPVEAQQCITDQAARISKAEGGEVRIYVCNNVARDTSSDLDV